MSEKYKEIFPVRLREMRDKRGLSQYLLAEKLGQSRSNVANYETGRNFPSTDALLHMSEILHTSIDYLLGKTDNPDLITGRDTLSIETLEDLPLTFRGNTLTEEQRRHVVLLLKSALLMSKNND